MRILVLGHQYHSQEYNNAKNALKLLLIVKVVLQDPYVINVKPVIF